MTATDLTPWTPPTAAEQMLTEAARRQAEHRAEIGRKVDEYAAMTVLGGAITGVAFTAITSPDLVGYPICTVLAATVIGAVVLYRSPKAAR